MGLDRSRKIFVFLGTTVDVAEEDGSLVGVAGRESTRWTRAIDSRSSSSVLSSKGSRFERIVPEKRTGS